MKIAIIGPGAIGLLCAAFLVKSKEEIWLLDKDSARAETIRQRGITLEGAV